MPTFFADECVARAIVDGLIQRGLDWLRVPSAPLRAARLSETDLVRRQGIRASDRVRKIARTP